MSDVENIEGFKIFEGDTLIIEDHKIHKCMEFFIKKKLSKIWISRFHGYLNDDVDFLKEYTFLKQVIINGPFDIYGLYCLSSLEYLSYNNPNKDSILDLSQFKKISTLFVDLKSKVINLNSLTEVRDIRLFNYSCKEKNLTCISNLMNLESLYISISNIESLYGVESFIKLQYIELHYLKNLIQIKELTSLSDSLKGILIGNSKKITDFDSIRDMQKLEILGFNNCGAILSINFLDDIPRLLEFRFVDTNILDGNLSPLVRLKYAGFLNKKHYSHTYEELARLHGHS